MGHNSYSSDRAVHKILSLIVFEEPIATAPRSLHPPQLPENLCHHRLHTSQTTTYRTLPPSPTPDLRDNTTAPRRSSLRPGRTKPLPKLPLKGPRTTRTTPSFPRASSCVGAKPKVPRWLNWEDTHTHTSGAVADIPPQNQSADDSNVCMPTDEHR